MNIIELAKEACFDIDEGLFPFEASEDKFIGTERTLEAFAALVRAEALAEPELNLNCKSVQKRLATVWGYVKAEQAKQEPVAESASYCVGNIHWIVPPLKDGTPLYAAPVGAEHFLKAIAALREGIATCRAEALAEHKCGGCAKTAADGWALYCVECWEKAEPVKQEPVAWTNYNGAVNNRLKGAPVSAKREWVELTDDEIVDASVEAVKSHRKYQQSTHGQQLSPADDYDYHLAHAVIAAFKEKNK